MLVSRSIASNCRLSLEFPPGPPTGTRAPGRKSIPSKVQNDQSLQIFLQTAAAAPSPHRTFVAVKGLSARKLSEPAKQDNGRRGEAGSGFSMPSKPPRRAGVLSIPAFSNHGRAGFTPSFPTSTWSTTCGRSERVAIRHQLLLPATTVRPAAKRVPRAERRRPEASESRGDRR